MHHLLARTHSSGIRRRLLLASALILVCACQPRQSDTDPGPGDPAPAPVGARGDTLPSPVPETARGPVVQGGTRYPSDRQTGGGSGDAEIQRLYKEAYAMASTGGCAASGDCRAAPVGSKPCGGPWEYMVYCRLSTDTLRLRTVLAELERRQREYNRKNQIGSICDMIMEPALTLSAGRCAVSGR